MNLIIYCFAFKENDFDRSSHTAVSNFLVRKINLGLNHYCDQYQNDGGVYNNNCLNIFVYLFIYGTGKKPFLYTLSDVGGESTNEKGTKRYFYVQDRSVQDRIIGFVLNLVGFTANQHIICYTAPKTNMNVSR